MLSIRVGNITVQFDRDGRSDFARTASVNWFGKPVFLLFDSLAFQFDLEGRIWRIDGFPLSHSWDWVQRTMANDWVYYDAAWYSGDYPQPAPVIGDSAWAVNGRTDLPVLQGHDGLQRECATQALETLDALIDIVRDLVRRKPEIHSESGDAKDVVEPAQAERVWSFLSKVARNDREQLQTIADRLREVHGGMEVLPPDTIDVDYRVLLVRVMDGCTNACRFCMARGSSAFTLKSEKDIDRQIEAQAEIYGADLYNYNAVVLGECDGLASPLVEYAATRAFDAFQCGASHHEGSHLFLFATNRTLCQQPDEALDRLDALPFAHVHINVGWEATTDAALSKLGKAQTAEEVLAGMAKAGEINRTRKKVRVSGNFIASDQYECHAVVKAIRQSRYRGPLYLSPLRGQCSGHNALTDLEVLKRFRPEINTRLYTMQRM